jgi:hypothetical protein
MDCKKFHEYFVDYFVVPLFALLAGIIIIAIIVIVIDSFVHFKLFSYENLS